MIRILVGEQNGCLGMGNSQVVFYELGLCLLTDGSDCCAFGIVSSVIAFAVDV
jgi:hypothetical protein